MCNHPDREAAMVTTHRDSGGKPTVWCDPCLEPLVRALNDGGIPTVASCCGHGHRPATVILRDGRWLFLVTEAEAEKVEAAFPVNINGDLMSERAGA